MSSNDYQLNGNNCSVDRIKSCDTKSLSLSDYFNILIRNVTNSSDKYDVWSDVLLDVIDNNVDNESMLGQVLTLTVDKSRSICPQNRIFSIKLLAKLCRRFNEKLFTESVYQTVVCLSMDSEPSVRAHISKHLSLLSQNLSSDTIESQILPLLTDLSNDMEVMVRMASIETLIDLIPKMENKSNKEKLFSHLISLFNSALDSNDSTLGLVFMNFGKLCQTLPKEVMKSEKWFLDYYFNVFLLSNDFQFKAKDICFNERDIHLRNLLALFFPILLEIYGPNDCLNSILNFLCSDIDISVVRSIASVFNEINSHLKNCYKIYPQLTKIVKHNNIILVKELMPFLSQLLIDAINSAPNENKDILLDDITKNLICCENTTHMSLDWRLQITFFCQLSKVVIFLPINQIEMSFIPLLRNRILTSRPIPVRIESSRCLLCIFRDLPILLEDINIYEWFVSTLCYGKSFSQRMLFLNVCQIVNELCDTKILINYFLEPLLSLMRDEVPNIRLNVCKKLINIKNVFEVSEIEPKVQKIKNMLKQMFSTETDRDVIQAINLLIDEFNWRSDFSLLTVEQLTQQFKCLNIETNFEVNNNLIENKDLKQTTSDSMIKFKSCLPQLIRSQPNSDFISKCLPNIKNFDNFDSIPSKIPKPITKSSK